VESETSFSSRGLDVNGKLGLSRPAMRKILALIGLSGFVVVVCAGQVIKRWLEVGLGRWCYAHHIRRPLMGCFSEVWACMSESNGQTVSLGEACQYSFLLALCLLPLCVIDMRLPVDSWPFATDASETGGGFCMGWGLSEIGKQCAWTERVQLRDPSHADGSWSTWEMTWAVCPLPQFLSG
jgi:hypothetical protein